MQDSRIGARQRVARTLDRRKGGLRGRRSRQRTGRRRDESPLLANGRRTKQCRRPTAIPAAQAPASPASDAQPDGTAHERRSPKPTRRAFAAPGRSSPERSSRLEPPRPAAATSSHAEHPRLADADASGPRNALLKVCLFELLSPVTRVIVRTGALLLRSPNLDSR
jgi:hypothetical protein